jgi:hypothetical protein
MPELCHADRLAFLPSTFTMYTTLLANSYWFHPATSTATGTSRAYKATLLFAVGAIVGWPFSAALAIPFVLEQLFTTGGEIAVGQDKQNLMAKRWDTMLRAIALGASISVCHTLSELDEADGRSPFTSLTRGYMDDTPSPHSISYGTTSYPH